MWIIGCDFHPSWQQVAWCNTETGETGEVKLVNGNGETERWYRQLPVPSRIGLEATGNSQWLVELLQRLRHEVWIGDAAQIRASYVRKQKTDKRDAGCDAHLAAVVGGPVSAWDAEEASAVERSGTARVARAGDAGAGCRRQDLLETLAYLDCKTAPLDRAAEETAQRDKMALPLKTQPGPRVALVVRHGG